MMFSKPLVALMLLARCFSLPSEDQQQQCLLSEKPSEEMVIIESTFSYVENRDCGGGIFAYLQGEQAPFVDFHKTGTFTPTYFDALSSLEQLMLDSQVLANAFSNDQCSAGLTKYNIVGDETNTYSDSFQELSVVGWTIDIKSSKDFRAHEFSSSMNFAKDENVFESFLKMTENQKRAQKRLELDPH